MPNFSFLEGAILTIPGGLCRLYCYVVQAMLLCCAGYAAMLCRLCCYVVQAILGSLRNKTKLQPSSVEVELWLSLAISSDLEKEIEPWFKKNK